MNRNILVGLVLIAVVFGFFYIQNQRQRDLQRQQEEEAERKKLELQARQAREGKVNVLRANVALPANTRVPETAVRVETISREFAPPNSNLKIDDVVDKFTTETIPKDDVINRLRLTSEQRSLESFLQEGERFYSVKMDGVSAVSGFVKQGDRIDVLAVMSYQGTQSCRTVMSNLEIFSVDQYRWEITADEKKKGNLGSITITFRLTGDQASRLIQLVQIGAQLKFSLRPPTDLDITTSQGLTLTDLLAGRKSSIKAAPGAGNVQASPEGGAPMVAIQIFRHKDVSQEVFPLTTGTADGAMPADLVPLPSAGQQPPPTASNQAPANGKQAIPAAGGRPDR